MASEGTVFEVRRDDWSQCRFVPAGRNASLAAGQVLFEVDRFALTSNNITYAQAGDLLQYWSFFPADEGWGRIPAMGYANVIDSAHPEVSVGERVFGFFPMATHLVIEAEHAGPQQFMDAAAHRAGTAPVYRQYARASTDPTYAEKAEDETLLLRGLFTTSFLVDDFLADNDDFGARSFVISSASSKTAIALAFQLHQRGQGSVIGLTSERNRAFVEGLGFYDRVLTYSGADELPQGPAVFVDHAGDGEVFKSVHGHFGDDLRHSCIVGATHVGAAPRAEGLPGATPEFFFAPAQIQKRSQEWGPAGLQQRLGGAWTRFRDESSRWLRVVRGAGPQAVERTYREVLEGRARPDEGHVLSLREGAA